MPPTRQIQTNFTAGEVSPRLLGRGDLTVYQNGALSLRNVFIYPTGGVTRRSGLYYMDTLPSTGRLIQFEFNTDQTYLLVVSDEIIFIYEDGVKTATLAAPWTAEQLGQISWTQNADTLLVCHPDVPPRRITRQADNTWQITEWQFLIDLNISYQPYYKFVDPLVSLTPNATTGTVTFTCSAPVFDNAHLNTRLRIQGKEVLITDVLSPTVIRGTAVQTLLGTTATIDWQEQAFSAVRGWPVSVAFHQDRLVIGGSRDLPNRLWFSKSGDLWNFDLGTAKDDEAIEFALLSDQVNAIRAVFSGRHLQVFTSGAEWMVTGFPLTPRSLQIARQTRVGSPTSLTAPPVNVDGATLFIARNRQEVREFVYTDAEQAYNANDVSLLSAHLLIDAKELAFDKMRRILYVVLDSGRVAALTIYRTESVAAWTVLETSGRILSTAVVEDVAYMIVDYDGSITLQRFDDDVLLDNALRGDAVVPQDTWSGLDHLNGQIVRIVGDGVVYPDQQVIDNHIVIDPPAATIHVGLPYTHIIEPLPPNSVDLGGAGRPMRLIEVVFRLRDTAALRADLGSGLKNIPLRRLVSTTLGQSPPLINGDVSARALGWTRDGNQPLWRIEHDTPLPFALLAVTTEIKVND